MRVLAFGGDVDSVGEIAELLGHSQDALSPLTKAMARARPDRRGAYAEVIERIRQGSEPNLDEV